MKVIPLRLAGASVIEPIVHGDQRGFFMESYNQQVMQDEGITHTFIQDNQSLSADAGVIRGLHYQLNPKAQTKLIRVLTGAIYDVILDIRISSPTFGQWMSVILSEYNHRQLLVPKGFAHGFCTLVPNTQVLYKVDEYYSPLHDRGILWNDPTLSIDWPTSKAILSEKDKQQPLLKDAEINFN
ncbi:dTDP-4-dehydrorhamnose 3,5-epimerase [Paenibacillus jamilae]|uniref:dTDP-4-dehydrorhamnose 3,5-epimerase n=1 Tax=Paenibacillus jamilae TaxID=114136 RepID=A0ACC4ZNF0_9BACL|nr:MULTISPECIES: dTDP-4-dehydrorhamnose 3,5-epimerase [Paenibacillus]AUO06978.1 dTDP-4-dehydrorhamnose 3,5-epimerase [Paenibacillus sp. lzh-N1]KTS75469.1 dTDP-4-dehydrorhamnose 3,5-epimerase [Paenibacillus jamilae]MEE4563359.1 dTDP-4-dehydrorhamnose 3,5-epimerase [Paenibacillus polymyxa]